MTTTRTVPVSACRFAADVDVEKTNGSDNVPLKVTARTSQPVYHRYWGAVVHDMSGMTVPKASIPLDYCHDARDVVGFADQFAVEGGNLVCSGALVPLAEADRASEIAAKAKRGVPYQASIFFDPGAVAVEDVGAGVTVQVNGRTLTGPATIFRKWSLRGVAICPYGVDPGTGLEFSDRGREVAVQTLTPLAKEATMAVETKPADKPAEKPADAGQLATDQKPAGTSPATGPGGVPANEGQPPAGQLAAPPTPEAPGKKFLDAFGEKGAVWFAEGKTFDEAQVLFAQHLRAENDRLAKENAELAGKVKLAAGESQPVDFSPPPSPDQKKAAALALKVGSEGVAKFAAALKVPDQKG